jgi:hypothetical protein
MTASSGARHTANGDAFDDAALWAWAAELIDPPVPASAQVALALAATDRLAASAEPV